MGVARTLLAQLILQGENARQESQTVADMRGLIADKLPTLPDAERAALALRQTSGEIGPVFLRATPEVIPVLACSWQDELDEIRLRVVFYRPTGAGGSLVAAGLRFESRDQDPGQDHHLYHAQPIVSLEGAKGLALAGTQPWAVVTAPTVPLPASTTKELVACVLLSIYGRSKTLEICAENGNTLTRAVRSVVAAAGYQ